jgi:hypothetical protein
MSVAAQQVRRSSRSRLGGIDDEVSSDPVYGKALENRTDTDDSPYSVNCLANSTDPNYSVAFAVNFIDAIGCRAAISEPYFRTGPLRDMLPATSAYSRKRRR